MGGRQEECTSISSSVPRIKNASLDITPAAGSKKMKQKKISHKTTQKVKMFFSSAFLSMMMKSSAQFCEGGNGLNVLFYLLILDMKTLDLEGYGVDFPFYCPPY